MPVSSGFFDSINEDRKYNAEQMSSLFDGIITEGVFQNVGSAFSVSVFNASRRVIRVGIGRAWLNGCWVYNSSTLNLTIPAAPTSPNVSRIDAVVIGVDKATAVRAGQISVVSGLEAASPVPPTMTNTSTKKQIPICYIRSVGGTTGLSAENITYLVGTDECPFVAAPLVQLSIDDYLSLWRQQFNQWLNSQQDSFETWMGDLDDMLTGNQAAELASRISQLENRITPINKGGTGASTKSAAKTNLGISIGTTPPEEMASQLDSNDIYIYLAE